MPDRRVEQSNNHASMMLWGRIGAAARAAMAAEERLADVGGMLRDRERVCCRD